MSDTDDDGLAVALLERLRTQRLPRAIDIKEKVDAGGILDEYDIAFLGEVLTDAERIRPYVDREPEYQDDLRPGDPPLPRDHGEGPGQRGRAGSHRLRHRSLSKRARAAQGSRPSARLNQPFQRVPTP